MDVPEATKRIERFVSLEHTHKDFTFALRAAEEAVQALPPGVSGELVSGYFSRLLELWPEVPPPISGLGDAALEAYLRIAARHPDSVWSVVLSEAAGMDVDALRTYAGWLHLAAKAAKSAGGGEEEELAAIRAASKEKRLLAALQKAWPGFDGPSRHRRPIGWAGILLQDGSAESVRLLRPLIAESAPETSYDSTIEDLYTLAPQHREPVRALRLELRALLDERDEAIGQNALFAALRQPDPPINFTLKIILVATKGQAFTFACSRNRGSSGIHWFATFGKKTPIWSGRSTRAERDKLGFGMPKIAELPAWLSRAGEIAKVKWTALRVEESGFSSPVEPAVREWLGGLLAKKQR